MAINMRKNLRDVFGFYTSPYWSDGQFQTSVPFGDTVPYSRTDANARYHDTAAALYTDYGHLTASDEIFFENTRRLRGAVPKVAGSAVLAGNFIGRNLGGLTNAYFPFQALALGKSLYYIYDYEKNREKYKSDVAKRYVSDPMYRRNSDICVSNFELDIPQDSQSVSNNHPTEDPTGTGVQFEQDPPMPKMVEIKNDRVSIRNPNTFYNTDSGDNAPYHPPEGGGWGRRDYTGYQFDKPRRYIEPEEHMNDMRTVNRKVNQIKLGFRKRRKRKPYM